jgi:hypothetical protein
MTIQMRTNHADIPYLTIVIVCNSEVMARYIHHSRQKKLKWTVTVRRRPLAAVRCNQFSRSWDDPIKKPRMEDFIARRKIRGT